MPAGDDCSPSPRASIQNRHKGVPRSACETIHANSYHPAGRGGMLILSVRRAGGALLDLAAKRHVRTSYKQAIAARSC